MEKNRVDEIKESAKQIEGQGSLIEPGTKVKKKPGRKPGQKYDQKKAEDPIKPKAEEIQIPTKEILKPGLHIISKSCQAWAEHEKAAMTENELDMGAELLGKLFDKYAPQALNKYGIEITCAVVFGQYGLRVIQLKRAVMQFKEKESQKPPSPNSKDILPEDKSIPNYEGPHLAN